MKDTLEIQMALIAIWSCIANMPGGRNKALRIWNDFELSKDEVYRVFSEYGHISKKSKSVPECQITFQDISDECWGILESLELI